MARTNTGTAPSRVQPTRRHYQPPNALGPRNNSRGPAKEGASAVQLKVTGWRKSKASSNEDGGVSSLTSWLERRAAIKKKSPVRIRKSRVDGDALIVTASGEDARFISMAHNLSFAGAPVTIETLSATGRGSTPSGRAPMTFSFLRNGEAAHSKDDSKLSAAEITEKFQAVLASRYVPDVKFLDLSDLASHPEIKAMGFTGNPFSRPSFFPALLKVVNQSFATPEAKEEAVHSVSLARNGLHRITPIRPLPQTFPHLKNLDLSGNLFERINAIAGWKTEFPQLEHIILTETKLEANVPDLRAQLIRWYPKLHMIDQVEITAEESAAARTVKPIPPTRPPVWEDRDQVGEKFLVDFYAGFDNDRKTLVNEYYDEKSRFSLSVNTSALRDPAAAPDAPKNQSWGQYIPQSRNLTRISHAAARAKRLHRGREDIARVFMSLPTTRHPSFGADDLHKWLLECRPQAHVPDPSGQYPQGVDGLLLTIHGEFEEPSTDGKAILKRSFDRTFVLGPGGAKGVRVVNDMITLRAYGGTQAFKTDDRSSSPDERQRMVIEVQKQTTMNAQYATMCLTETGWVLADAIAAFTNNRANIPAEAYVQ